MAQKKSYLYRMLIGTCRGEYTDIQYDIFCVARNAKVAKEYCKEKYRDKKFNYYQAIKVGVSHTLRDTEILSDDETWKLRQSIATKGEKYREIEMEVPKFITKEEAEELL